MTAARFGAQKMVVSAVAGHVKRNMYVQQAKMAADVRYSENSTACPCRSHKAAYEKIGVEPM